MSFEQQIFFTTLLVSLLVHAAFFVQWPNTVAMNVEQAPKVATRVTLNMLPPPKKPQQVVKVDIPPPPATPRKPDPVPESKPKPKPRSKPEVVVPRIIKPPRPIVQEQAAAPIVAQKIQRQPPIEPEPFNKQDYFSYLLTHIEGHKHYPRSARQRRIEGNIKVSFQLQENGAINGLVTSGGPLILRRAAKLAVERATPLPTPPAEINCPLQVSYSMKFQLR